MPLWVDNRSKSLTLNTAINASATGPHSHRMFCTARNVAGQAGRRGSVEHIQEVEISRGGAPQRVRVRRQLAWAPTAIGVVLVGFVQRLQAHRELVLQLLPELFRCR